MLNVIKIVMQIVLIVFNTSLNASSVLWSTGPIENNGNVMLSKGELYLFPDMYRFELNPFTRYGGYLQVAYQYTDTWQVQLEPRYNYNTNALGSAQGWSALPILIGYQLTREHPDSYLPAIKLNIRQTFPTSRYDNFDPRKQLLEKTGSAFYQTAFLINTQRLSMPIPDHLLKHYLTVEYGYRPSKHITGFNNYGGGFGTNGTMSANQRVTINSSYEFQLTQNWVALFQWDYNYKQSSSFDGVVGVNADGSPARVYKARLSQWSLFPVLEYNFNQYVGLAAGYWFSLNQRDEKFHAIQIALNYVC